MAAKKGKPDRGEGGEKRDKVITTEEVVSARFATKYTQEVTPALIKQFNYKNPNQVPKLKKIVIYATAMIHIVP